LTAHTQLLEWVCLMTASPLRTGSHGIVLGYANANPTLYLSKAKEKTAILFS